MSRADRVGLRVSSALALCAALGCATPVGVRKTDEREVYRQHAQSVLSTGTPSAASQQVLLRQGLFELFVEDPEGTLRELHERTLAEMSSDSLLALAEYSQLVAERYRRPAYHMAAVVYAYTFLVVEKDDALPNALDPRLRLAADLYNTSLASALQAAGGAEQLGGIGLPEHVGTLEVTFDEASLHWAGRKLTDFASASDLEVRGLRNRYRRSGLGAAFAAAAVAEPGSELDAKDALIADRVRVPVSFILRIEDPLESLRAGALKGRLELYNSRDTELVEIGGDPVVIEYETSAALALALDGAPVWDTEIAGFRNPRAVPENGRLAMWGPHRAGRIPVVFVHGTASSPARWAEMLNELESDPRIRQTYEFWFFTYPTGGPILYSASLLRTWLTRTVATLDPEGRDAGLQRMVLIGHSQGGLLAKLQVIPSEALFWRNLSKKPFADAKLEPETRALLEGTLFFEPLPFVRTVVFISTPQRGSYLAGDWLGRLATRLTQTPGRLVSLPLDLAKAGMAVSSAAVDLVQGDEDAALQRRMERLPSSVDNMTPNQPFIKTLSGIRVGPPVVVHSIIPVKGGPPPGDQNDGVVAYKSAHIEEAESEYVVFHHGHSAQESPQAIQEVRRILLAQIGEKSEPEPNR